MKHKIIEIKARCNNQTVIREILRNGNAEFKGTDHQTDTYFIVSNGRLKLREGNIENSLIHYFRDNVDEPKESDAFVYQNNTDKLFKELLIRALGVLVVVDKVREIYFIDNVKFHLDQVEGFGEFVEIEAIGNHNASREDLMHQCRFYLNLFEIQKSDLITHSYSDLLIQKKEALS
jgi:predicted adenylyl cyclase CyaB